MQQEQLMGDSSEHDQRKYYAQPEQSSGDRLGHEQQSQLEQELEEGEQLLWFDRPQPGSRNRQSPIRVLLTLTIIFGSIGLFLALLAVVFLLALPLPHPAPSIILFSIGGIFILTSLILGIISIALRFTTSNQLYAITNQRIIIIMRKGLDRVVASYTSSDLGPISRVEHPDGSGDLIFKERPAYSYNYNYRYSYGSNSSSSSSNSGYGSHPGKFIGVRNVHDVERLLRRTFKSNH